MTRPQPIHDAYIELESTRWLWESTEEQVSALIDATIQRIAERDYPFWEDNEEAILQRDRVEREMRRSARFTTLLRAWMIFEHAACWTAEELRHKGQAIGQKRSAEGFMDWAERELSFASTYPFRHELLEWMNLLCQLRNVIVHTDGHTAHMRHQHQAHVDQWLARRQGVLLHEGRLDISEDCVGRILEMTFQAIGSLSEPFRE